jgi:hypothetical protein
VLNNVATAPGNITMVCPYIRHVNGWSEAGNLTYKKEIRFRSFIYVHFQLSFLSPRQLEHAALQASHIASAVICVPSIVSLLEFKSIFANVSVGVFILFR